VQIRLVVFEKTHILILKGDVTDPKWQELRLETQGFASRHKERHLQTQVMSFFRIKLLKVCFSKSRFTGVHLLISTCIEKHYTQPLSHLFYKWTHLTFMNLIYWKAVKDY